MRLKREAKAIRKGHVATALEEHALGICALGGSFKDTAGQIFSVSVPIPNVRFMHIRSTCESLLKAHLQFIQQMIWTA